MKKIIYWVAAFLCMACSDDHGANQEMEELRAVLPK